MDRTVRYERSGGGSSPSGTTRYKERVTLVEWSGLENRRSETRSEGSNPSLSAKYGR